MNFKFYLLIIFSLFFMPMFASAATYSYGVCGDGVLSPGEQCDAGNLVYPPRSVNFPDTWGCNPTSCTCSAGVSTEIRTFEFAGQCISLTVCKDQGECSEEDSQFDMEHPHCGCGGGEPECKCPEMHDDRSWGSIGYAEGCSQCHTHLPINLQQQLGSRWAWGASWTEHGYEGTDCYCGNDFNGELGNTLSKDAYPYCAFFGLDCIWKGEAITGCGPANSEICDNGQPKCYYLEGGYVVTTCCNSDQICDGLNGGCIDEPSAGPPLQENPPVSIKVGDGNDQSRNVICSTSITPSEKGYYKVKFTLEGTSLSSDEIVSEYVDEVGPCLLLKPSPVKFEHTFDNVLKKDSIAFKCRADYTLASGETGSAKSNKLMDIDGDGDFSKKQLEVFNPWSFYDVDDWVFNDTLYGDSTLGNKCITSASTSYSNIMKEVKENKKNCIKDNNNDGIGDYAACSYCRYTRAPEDADDIDNNGWGFCQADVGRSCRIEGDSYIGDGADDGSSTNLPAQYGANAKMGCGGVKNKFNITDTFCQMVDNLPGMKAYERAVKWGEIKDDSETTTNSGQILTSYTLTSFKPGAVSNSFGIESLGGNLNIFSDLESVAVRCGSETVVEQSIPNSNPALEFQNVNVVYDKLFLFETDGKNDESKGKSRDTAGIEDQYIDSFRGECDFKKFWNDAETGAKLQEKDSSGNFIWQWKTAFVPRDKCNDGANNDGDEDLFNAVPYGNYVSLYQTFTTGGLYDPATGAYTLAYPQQVQFKIPLVDVDDSQCKFDSYQSVAVNSPHYNWPADYKINPVTSQPYCLDKDEDGFCGAKLKFVDNLGSCNTYHWDSQGNIVCDTYNQEAVQDFSDKEYVLSNQFPDCDDNPLTNYLIGSGNKPMFVSKNLGWGDDVVGQPFTSWNVHPFAPVTFASCYNDFDTNCNKEGVDGINAFSLANGGTPFDYSLSTGREIQSEIGKFIRQSGDIQCTYYDPQRKLTDDWAIGIGYSVTKTAIQLGVTAVFPPAGAVFFGISAYDSANRWNKAIFDNKNGASDYALALADTGLLFFSAKSLANNLVPQGGNALIPLSSGSSYGIKDGYIDMARNSAGLAKDAIATKNKVFSILPNPLGK